MEKTKEALAMLEYVKKRLDNALYTPWNVACEPYQVVPNVYYVGNTYVGSYLLNTKKGLVLLDVAMQETAYLLFESIRKLGFDPAAIKTVLISHGHIDHCGAARLVQEYSDCEIYFPEGDLFFLTERRDLIIEEKHVPEFRVDHIYDYNSVLDFGNVRVRPVHTPGHTPGCTSFFISVDDCGGETLTLAMHGGLLGVGLSKAELEEKNLPFHLQTDYKRSLERLMDEPVDIIIPSHRSHYHGDYLALVAQNDGTGKVLRIPGDWKKLITKYLNQINEIILRDEQHLGQ